MRYMAHKYFLLVCGLSFHSLADIHLDSFISFTLYPTSVLTDNSLNFVQELKKTKIKQKHRGTIQPKKQKTTLLVFED